MIGRVTIVTLTIPIGKFLPILPKSFLRFGELVEAAVTVVAVLVASLVLLVLMHTKCYLVLT
jgi:hypothetical protein